MKSKLLLPFILIIGLMILNLSANSVYGQTSKIKQAKEQPVKYTCPQHPEVVLDKPGTCPKCGMTLIDQNKKSKEDKKQACDSTKMKSEEMKMKCDSTKMKKM
jgi:hypothetical protein